MRRLSSHLVKTLPSPSGPRYETYFRVRISEPDENGCILWRGPRNSKGYGVLGLTGSGFSRAAHRYAYESRFGPIPEGLTLDHKCYVRLCVNPIHLEPVTQAENAARRRRSTHCPKGHEMTPENTYVSKPDSHRVRPQVHCRECTLARQRERYAKYGRRRK